MASTTASSTIATSGCAFATNDERTARRISDALGTATELRAMKNYAGHRLAPWLSHLMVSRQETARPLLTPGRGHAAAGDRRDRHDRRTAADPGQEAPLLRGARRSRRALLPAPALSASRVCRIDRPCGPTTGRRQRRSRLRPRPPRSWRPTDPANGGIRQEPELPVHEEVAPPPAPADEFAFAEDEADDEPQRQRVLARLQTHDPCGGDGSRTTASAWGCSP